MRVRKSIWIPIAVVIAGFALSSVWLDRLEEREQCVRDLRLRTGRILEWDDPCHLARTVVPQMDAMRDALEAHLDRFLQCRDSGVAVRGIDAWDDINHECRQAPHVDDWREVEAEYEHLRLQVNRHWEPLGWFAMHVGSQNGRLEPLTQVGGGRSSQ